MGEGVAKAKEVIGYAAGDREVEAKARVEGQGGDPDEEHVEQDEELQVRVERGEVKPQP